MMTDLNRITEAFSLLALAQFSLDVASGLKAPSPWDVAGRQELQDEARRLLVQVRALRKAAC